MSAASVQPRHALDVLLVEDDEGDVVIAQEALRAGRLNTRLSVVRDGVAAMAYLRKEDEYSGAERPDIILLDLNLPRKSGHEVLAEMKADESLRRIPVVVLSTSASVADVVKSYDLHANVYVPKPVDFDEFTSVITQIDEFFASTVQLSPE
ncbi:MAG: hypothetical protein QOG80_1348 [Pseudonocardiales bacterium]|jgi:chemotaxis family two-component system response regulator Rcp1|nr:hypothetical protein [Pseudonocardiales bacterium]